ncbi:unnamed protein product [Adineta ricciae]|uniref:TIR domain-containing protein n=1 Tax=Adineta ricciae TaxID=249248 RepID=A0A815LXW3_ADIRI|nr:unnamed protein product [Adineta ricciae]
MQPSTNYDYFPQTKSICQRQWTIEDVKYFLDSSVRKLPYKPHKRTSRYVKKTTRIIKRLNEIPLEILLTIPSHEFYISSRNLLRDILDDWHSLMQLSEEEIDFVRNGVLLFKDLVDLIPDVSKLTSWLIDSSFVESVATCMSNIDQLLSKHENKQMFKQLTRLLSMFSVYYERLPSNAEDKDEFYRLFLATMNCLVSSNYERVFKKLKPYAKSMTREQKFFLIQCPSFLISYRGLQSKNIIDQLLGTMIPRYASLLDKHIQSIKEWKSSMIHAIHHLLLTVTHVRGYYTPYANGQPIKWLIDHIIRILSEPIFIEKISKKSTNSETVLIRSALQTLTILAHEPDLLIYLKQLKITSIFRSLAFVNNESIVLHAYVMLSYTLEEDDIKASEKASGRLLTKILDTLRKKIQSISVMDNDEESTNRNIALLMEAIQALVQHDQIKSEILKQNALHLLVNHCQKLNDRSKRLVLESLGSITFDEEAARMLRGDEEVIKSIEDMQKDESDGIRKAAEKILWNLFKESEREKKTNTKKKMTESDDKKEDQPKKVDYQYDIMISYCHADKELVYRVQQFLADHGFKIWVDRDNIYGPAMQAMADAVENSEFVILCMSDSYKRSVYCQAEAEYAFRCKRNLIPIIVRQGYRADGWLGLIIGSRIYVDFGRMDFKKACELILKEITLQRGNQINEQSKTVPHQSSPETSVIVTKSIEQPQLPDVYIKREMTKVTYRTTVVNQWTQKDVLDFLFDINLHYMMPICELLNGNGLIKLFRICQTKPSRLYSQLNEELMFRFDGLHLPIGIFTQFLSEIDQLINSSTVRAIEQDALRSTSSSSSSTPTQSTAKTSKSRPPKKPSTQLSPIASSIDSTSPKLTTTQAAYRTQPLSAPSTNIRELST